MPVPDPCGEKKGSEYRHLGSGRSNSDPNVAVRPQESTDGRRHPPALIVSSIMTPSVLLVDADGEAVNALAALLGEIGCQVSSTLDPRLALAFARKCKPDIAFIGLRMPYMTGSYLASMLREEKALDGCAMVALSKPGNEHGWLSVRADFQGLLSKFATLDEVSAAVEVFAG